MGRKSHSEEIVFEQKHNWGVKQSSQKFLVEGRLSAKALEGLGLWELEEEKERMPRWQKQNASWKRGGRWAQTNSWKSGCMSLASQNMLVLILCRIEKASLLGWEDPREKTMVSTSVFLPGEFLGQKSLVGYSPQSYKGLDMTEWQTLQLFSFRKGNVWRCWVEKCPNNSCCYKMFTLVIDIECTNYLNSPISASHVWNRNTLT